MDKEKEKELINYAVKLYSSLSADRAIEALMRQGADKDLAVKIFQQVDKDQRKKRLHNGKIALFGGGALFAICFLISPVWLEVEHFPLLGKKIITYYTFFPSCMGLCLIIMIIGIVDIVISKKKKKRFTD